MAVALDLAEVGKDFLIPIIDRVSFTVDAGDFVCLLGPNGCGKTTLLRIIGGLEAPTRGRVLFGQSARTIEERPGFPGTRRTSGGLGGPAARPPMEGGRPRIGVVFQEDRLLPWLTVRDNVELVLTPLGLDRGARRDVAGRYLRLVGLGGFEDYYPGRVSGGMRQRAAIARALAVEPDVLLMDEPFGALDAQNRRIMQTEVRRIWRETGRTIVFVTHSIEEAVEIGTTLVMLSARPARVRVLLRNDGRTERTKLVDDLNTMIMEEVGKQQGGRPA